MAQEQEAQRSKAPEQGSAGTREKKEQGIARKSVTTAPTRSGGLWPSPFSMVRRLTEDMDRLFADFFGHAPMRWGAWPSWSEALAWPSGFGETVGWPEIEVQQSGDKLVVQADIPGIKKDDVNVEVRDHELCISGERRSEWERTEGGYYRSERHYGSFCRVIPLPDEAKPDTASATFEDGVLKIEMEAPGLAQGRTRRIEVREGSPH